MILIIDTVSDPRFLALFGKDLEKIKTFTSDDTTTELQQKISLLVNQKIKKQISHIVVNIGPGGYTQTRCGVSFANALAFSLNIPIIGVKNRNNLLIWVKKNYLKIIQINRIHFVKPYYAQKPKITYSKPFL